MNTNHEHQLAVSTKIVAALEGADKDLAFEGLVVVAFALAQRMGCDPDQALAKISTAAAFAAQALR